MVSKVARLPDTFGIASFTNVCFMVALVWGFHPLGGYVKLKVLPRFELGSLDSESRVLTITP